MEQTTTKLSALSRITSSSYSFQPATDSSSQACPMGDSATASRTASANSTGDSTQAAAGPAQGKGSTYQHRIADSADKGFGFVQGMCRPAVRNGDTGYEHGFAETADGLRRP